MKIDHTAFFNDYRTAYGRLSQDTVNGVDQAALTAGCATALEGILRSAIVG